MRPYLKLSRFCRDDLPRPARLPCFIAGLAIDMNKVQEPIRHHFLPVFYLKNWCDEGRLVEFSIPFKSVKPKRVHPKATGFIDRLYAIEGLPGEVSFEVEKSFLSPVNSRAATALSSLLRGEQVTPQEREAWARFIMTLLMRMPAEIDLLKELVRKIEIEAADGLSQMLLRHIPAEHQKECELAIQTYKQNTQERLIRQMLRAMSHEKVISQIAGMHWATLDLQAAPNELLVSDRPVVIHKSDSAIGETVMALPVGPRKLFAAATKPSFIKELRNAPNKKVAEAINLEVVSAASRFVYGRSDRQLAFVQNRFGTNRRASFVAEILANAGVNTSEVTAFMAGYEDPAFKSEIASIIAQRSHAFEN